jgi:hypothetical protein
MDLFEEQDKKGRGARAVVTLGERLKSLSRPSLDETSRRHNKFISKRKSVYFACEG